jgi:hypothetical protein
MQQQAATAARHHMPRKALVLNATLSKHHTDAETQQTNQLQAMTGSHAANQHG